jgi:hypothetical protein
MFDFMQFFSFRQFFAKAILEKQSLFFLKLTSNFWQHPALVRAWFEMVVPMSF